MKKRRFRLSIKIVLCLLSFQTVASTSNSSLTIKLLVQDARDFLIADSEGKKSLIQSKNIKSCLMPGEAIKAEIDLPECTLLEADTFRSKFSSTTQGLFLPSRAEGRESYLLLAKDAGHWTYAHEYMHALINSHSPIEFEEDREAQNMLNAIEDLNDVFNKYRETNKLESVTYKTGFESLKTWIEAYIRLSERFELEEVAIESALRELYHEEAMKVFLKEEEYQNSSWYLNKNCRKVLSHLDAAKNQIQYYVEIGEKIQNSEVNADLGVLQVKVDEATKNANELCN